MEIFVDVVKITIYNPLGGIYVAEDSNYDYVVGPFR